MQLSVSEIIHCYHLRLIHKRFQVTPEEVIQRIEVWGMRRPSNRFSASNLPPGICSIKIVTLHNRKMYWCAIILESQALIRSYRNSLQQLQEKWEICTCQVTLAPPRCSRSSLHSFGSLPRLAHRLSDVCYYRSVDRLTMVCSPMLYGNLSSRYRLL
ncbi:hypothetical protein TNCV_1312451 [Trichonephila clavipes]|nr:hypothetical protein TNCV_1312451 [Trichonephila clavipes]